MTDFKKLKSENPVIKWRKRLPLISRILNFKSYSKTKNELDNYISILQNLKNNNQKDILEVVKEIVYKLNDLDEENSFIDTIEREDLCEFIQNAAIEVGLKVNEHEDITEIYRSW